MRRTTYIIDCFISDAEAYIPPYYNHLDLIFGDNISPLRLEGRVLRVRHCRLLLGRRGLRPSILQSPGFNLWRQSFPPPAGGTRAARPRSSLVHLERIGLRPSKAKIKEETIISLAPLNLLK